MSEKMFQAVDEVSSQGLEFMLAAIGKTACDEKDYSTAVLAWNAEEELRAGLLDKDAKKRPDYCEKRKTIAKRNNLVAAQWYQEGGNMVKAAEHFSEAGEDSKAIELYLQDGSKESVDRARFLLIDGLVDVERGIKLLLEQGDVERAFYNITDLRGRIPAEQYQHYGEIVVKAMYAKMVDAVKQKIASQGKAVPETNSLSDLMASHKDDVCLTPIHTYDHPDFYNTRGIVSETKDFGVLNIGLDIVWYRKLITTSLDRNEPFITEEEMVIRGKLGEIDNAVAYFLGRMSATKNKDEIERLARDAIKVCSFADRTDEALAFAETFLPPHNHIRFDLLKQLGDNERLSAAYREIGNPVHYALAKAGKIVE